jgi:hypothetical protein
MSRSYYGFECRSIEHWRRKMKSRMVHIAQGVQSERYTLETWKGERQLTEWVQIVEVKLADSINPSLKKIKRIIPELTRHERGTRDKILQKNRKPQGRKRKPENASRSAKYHDWLTPLCWTQIVIVAKQVGWKMGASDIANGLRKRDPVIFKKNQLEYHWGVDWPQQWKPQWKESVLRHVQSASGKREVA